MADEGVHHEHDPTNESTFKGAPSAPDLHASPSPTTTTLPTPDPAAATSTPITTPPMAEGTGFTGMPTYPAYGVDPSSTAFPEATTASDLAHANCTPFFSPKHLDFVTSKNSFFCHLENTVFQTLPKNAFFISFAHFLMSLGGSNNHSLVQNQRVHRSFSPKKIFLANLKNTNFWIVWKTIKDGRCSHILYMST